MGKAATFFSVIIPPPDGVSNVYISNSYYLEAGWRVLVALLNESMQNKSDAPDERVT